jgi:hypothetical protein
MWDTRRDKFITAWSILKRGGIRIYEAKKAAQSPAIYVTDVIYMAVY